LQQTIHFVLSRLLYSFGQESHFKH
jgi:hypothetical protein